MIIETNELGYLTITPEEGKFLTNGEVYADSKIYLGKFDNAENWWEVDEIIEEEDSFNTLNFI